MNANKQNIQPRTTAEPKARTPFHLRVGQIWRAGRRVLSQVTTENLMLVAAGVAFYGLLGFFPALASGVSLYGLFSDPMDIAEVSRHFRTVVPGDVLTLIVDQLHAITSESNGALSFGALGGLLVTFWSANKATKALFTGLNIAYREQEKRNFFVLNAVSLLTTVSITVAAVLGVAVVTGLPFVFGGAVMEVLRWSALGTGMMAFLAVLYRFGPSRRQPRWQWVSVGSVTATLSWIVSCIGFSYYVETFGTYNETFGALGGVAILLTWMWISAFMVMVGAQINAELEFATLADSTVGEDRARGQRGAFVADNIPIDDNAAPSASGI